MRLELDQNPTTIPFVEKSVPEASENALEIRQVLRDGIKAANSGNRQLARVSLLRVTELDPKNENAWLWLASISEFPEELLAFLSRVLEINSENERALEWAAATKTLLAKTFVQRGIDAFEESNSEFAQQCFTQALAYDEENVSAWLWMASLADSIDGKINYLEKVLSIDPENETALERLAEARKETTKSLLHDAQAAAVSGNVDDAKSMLKAILEEMPESEEAWILNSHFADSFEEKIHSFEMVLGINPKNTTAMMSLESLRSIMASVAPEPVDEVEMEAVSASVIEVEEPEVAISEMEAFEVQEPAEAVSQMKALVDEEIEDESSHRHPTQELVFPVEAAYLNNNDEAEKETVQELASYMDSDDELYTTEEVHFESQEATQELEASSEIEVSENVSEQIFITAAPEAVEESAPEHFAGPVEVTSEPEEAFYYYEEPTADVSDEDEKTEEPVPSPFDQTFGVIPVSAQADTVVEDKVFESSTPLESTEPPSMSSEYSDLMASLRVEDQPLEVNISEDEGIPMPTGMLEALDNGSAEDVFKTRIMYLDTIAAEAQGRTCPFCSSSNDSQAFVCQTCMAMLTLSDLEMLLANQHADKVMVRTAVEKMERERSERKFSEQELTVLGIGHLNLRNFQFGYDSLQEAAQLNPNNVVLQGQVNALHIRLDEIRKQEESDVSKPKGKNILVVDDSPTVRKLISGKLEKCGHSVFCAEDGVQAMGQLSSMIPDLILLDINMPRMDGYQVCKLIRTNDETKDVPVVMISGKDGFFDKVRGRMAGTSGYITKPFGPETLMKAIETYLKLED